MVSKLTASPGGGGGGAGYLFNGTYDQKYPKGGVVFLPYFEKYPGYFFDTKIGCILSIDIDSDARNIITDADNILAYYSSKNA